MTQPPCAGVIGAFPPTPEEDPSVIQHPDSSQSLLWPLPDFPVRPLQCVYQAYEYAEWVKNGSQKTFAS